ncbi:hypoxanthine phosphoribosyltransferase [bacterium]|nr:hypoxanthine phosphoribosyltransferase [bacterium]
MQNKNIFVHNQEFELLIAEADILKRVAEMAAAIHHDYKNKDLVVIGVLNGVFMFFSDLVKHINLDASINFIKVASYIGQETLGKVRELVGFSGELRNRHVLVVDDILDSGHTYQFLMESLMAKHPASIKFACLLHKPAALKVPAKPDYVGFEIANEFVVGYGLDFNQSGRSYRDIYKKK